jgi:hypothetical protein
MCHEIRNFVKLVDIASIAERGMHESSAAYELKRRAASQATYPSKRPALSTGSRPAEKRNFPPTTGNQALTFHKCGKVHAGECKANEPNCFRCGQFGHFKRNCPLDAPGGSRPPGNNFPPRRPAQARVYTLTPVEVDEEEERGVNDVVTGTIFLFGILACTLFDSGATHSFISEAYIKLCHVSTRPLVQSLTVETPGGKKVICNKMVENCPINIKGRNLPINLSVFKSLGYDVILGMDWLSKYYASINYREKVVVFQLPSVERFKFNGSCTRATPPLLSIVQATRNIRQGASAFLAYVTAKPEAERTLEDIPVACDYPDVFAEVVTGLPPDREIEFTIDLIPGTQPIHKAPYRMAPAELKEIKKQLQELLDRGFIRPSVSRGEHQYCLSRRKMGLCDYA